MTKKQFSSLNIGDIVITNKQSRTNAGIKCKVIYICDDRIWIEPIDGKEFEGSNRIGADIDEVCYRSVNTA